MELIHVIYFYAISIVIIYIICIQYGLRSICSIMISLILGQIFMNILKPPQDLDDEYKNIDSSIAFYATIQLLTPIVVYFYAIYVSINNYTSFIFINN